MLEQIEKLSAFWWFDPALSTGLGILTWLIGGLATYWLFQRGEKLRLAEQLRDFGVRAMEVNRTHGSSDARHHIILEHELDMLRRKEGEFKRYGVALDEVFSCGEIFLVTAEEAQRRGKNYKTRFGDFIRALKAAIRTLGRGGRFREMLRVLDQLNEAMGQGETKRKWRLPFLGAARPVLIYRDPALFAPSGDSPFQSGQP